MTRRAFLATALGVAAVKPTRAEGFHVTGTLTTTETERTEGYFQLGSAVMVAVRPQSYQHEILTGMVNQDVQLSIVVP